MSWLTDAIGGWFRGVLIEGIISNFTDIFDDINARVGGIADQVGQTPAGWNINIFNMVRTLSETVVIPVAGVILTFILCYELIHAVIERNNMHDFDSFIIFKWIFKTFCAVLILTHTFDIVMFVFGIAQNVVNNSAGIISGSLDIELVLTDFEAQLELMSTGGLIGLFLQSSLMGIAMTVISICVFIIIYGRMIEIYLLISIAPIPFSTMVNREWGGIGNSYLKSLFALAFQGFLIMVCVAIYSALVASIPSADNINMAALGMVAYTVLLVLILFRTGSLARGVFGAG